MLGDLGYVYYNECKQTGFKGKGQHCSLLMYTGWIKGLVEVEVVILAPLDITGGYENI